MGSTINIKPLQSQRRNGLRAIFPTGLALGLRLGLALTLFGCQKHEYVPDAKFVDLYVELKLATVGYANDQDKVSEVRRVILAQHQKTPEDFHNHYVRLMAHPEAWRKFQEAVIQQVEASQAAHKKEQAEIVNKVDSVDKVEKKK